MTKRDTNFIETKRTPNRSCPAYSKWTLKNEVRRLRRTRSNKLTKQLQATEIEMRAAVTLEGTDPEPERRDDVDAEGREKRQLLGKASFGKRLHSRGNQSGKAVSRARKLQYLTLSTVRVLVPLELV